ncbi:hypothetical protein BDW74DRAFT_182786 [Aspergillus multicolor]|uniref:uncharacterized protein n=1 Tax=Aspergillus multicolor TaxID=41759 RepID=UPI003CCE3BA6
MVMASPIHNNDHRLGQFIAKEGGDRIMEDKSNSDHNGKAIVAPEADCTTAPTYFVNNDDLRLVDGIGDLIVVNLDSAWWAVGLSGRLVVWRSSGISAHVIYTATDLIHSDGVPTPGHVIGAHPILFLSSPYADKLISSLPSDALSTQRIRTLRHIRASLGAARDSFVPSAVNPIPPA